MERDYHKPSTYKSFCYLLGAVLTYSIGSFYFGYAMGYFNSIHFKQIHQAFQITMSEERAEGIFSGCLPFGAMIGAYCSSYIIKKFSRRQSFLVVDVIAIIANLLVLMKSTNLLIIGRLMQGFCVGVFSSLVPLMVKQFSPLELSGSFGGLMAPSIGLGFFSAYLLSYVLNRYYSAQDFWIISFGFPMLLISIQMFLLLKVFINQTPKFLLSHAKFAQARDLIQKLYKVEQVERILEQKMRDLEGNKNNDIYEPTTSVQIDKQTESVNFQEKKQACEAQNSFSQNTISTNSEKIYPTDIRLAKIFAFFLQAFHQFSGINVIVVYGAHLARSSIPQLTDEIPIIINAQKILAGLCGTILLNKFGRRYLMLRGQIVILCCLIGLSIGFALDRPDSSATQLFIFVCLIIYVSIFVVTLGPITWLYIPQIVQPPTVSLTTMLNWILACIIITVFPMIKTHLMPLFIFFSFVNSLNIIMCYFLMIQTKGKKQIQIRNQFTREQQNVEKFSRKVINFVRRVHEN